MSENDQKNFSADIPEDAIKEALESVDRKIEAPAEEEAVVEVEVEPPADSLRGLLAGLQQDVHRR